MADEKLETAEINMEEQMAWDGWGGWGGGSGRGRIITFSKTHGKTKQKHKFMKRYNQSRLRSSLLAALAALVGAGLSMQAADTWSRLRPRLSSRQRNLIFSSSWAMTSAGCSRVSTIEA